MAQIDENPLGVHLPLDPLLRPALGKEIYPDLTGALVLRAIELPLAYLMSLALFRGLAALVTRPSRLVTFFVDGALAIYLFHLVWAMMLLPAVRALPLRPEFQWLLAATGVLLLATLSYVIVRSNRLTATLFCGTPARQPEYQTTTTAPAPVS